MSRHDLLFNPRSLARVVEKVEWEPELVWYKDGHSNQELYTQCWSMLLERWIREFALYDMLDILHSTGSREWLQVMQKGLSTMKNKIEQCRGFWEGLWYGANPRGVRAPNSSRIAVMGMRASTQGEIPQDQAELAMLNLLSSFFRGLRELSNDSFTRPPVAPRREA